MRLLLFAAALRKDSLNKRFIRAAARTLEGLPVGTVNLVEMNAYPMPVYDGDLETTEGIPKAVEALSRDIGAADGVVISTPEYNGGIPGPLKNAIDWVSRCRPMPLAARPILLLGASTGALGAIRGLWHTRVPLEALGSYVYPEMFGLSQAHQAFDESGGLKDPKQAARLDAILRSFQTFVESHSTGKSK